MIQLSHNTNYLKQRNHVYSLGMKIGKVILQKTNHDAAYLISFSIPFALFRKVAPQKPYLPQTHPSKTRPKCRRFDLSDSNPAEPTSS